RFEGLLGVRLDAALAVMLLRERESRHENGQREHHGHSSDSVHGIHPSLKCHDKAARSSIATAYEAHRMTGVPHCQRYASYKTEYRHQRRSASPHAAAGTQGGRSCRLWPGTAPAEAATSNACSYVAPANSARSVQAPGAASAGRATLQSQAVPE